MDGALVAPSTQWMKVYLQSGGKTFTAVNDPTGEEGKYCHVEGDKLVIDVPGKRLGIGILEYMIETRETSRYFADGYKNTFPLNWKQTDIEIV